MIWILLALLAAGLIVALLSALRRYEREGVTAARADARALREEVASLRSRVEALEAIAADGPLAAPDRDVSTGGDRVPPSSGDADAVSSARRTGT